MKVLAIFLSLIFLIPNLFAQDGLNLLEKVEAAQQDVRSEKAFILIYLGYLVEESDRKKARRRYEQSLALYRELGDQWGVAHALERVSKIAWEFGIYDEAKQLAEESLSIRQQLGDKRGIANILNGLGLIAKHQGQLEKAERRHRQSLAQSGFRMGARRHHPPAWGLCAADKQAHQGRISIRAYS